MNEHFVKFKKRVLRDTLIKCGLAAVATALIAVNAVLLPCALCGVRLFALWYVLIALGGLALGGGAVYACLRSSESKVAKRLDTELGLRERVQTALQYSNEQSDMLLLQRADTKQALADIPVRKLPFRHLALTVVLAALCAFGAVSVPVIAVYGYADPAPKDTVPVDPPRPVTDWEWAALDDLIAYVKASKKADTQVKTGMVQSLEGLRAILQSGVSQNGLSVFVQNTVSEIRNTVRDANERPEISDEQKVGNSEEESYVISKLYEIFGLTSGGGNDPGETPGENPGEENPEGPGGTGTGELLIDGVAFFDPERGYVKCGEVRAEYKEIMQKALQEGTISQEEWEYIMETYFADLGVKKED